LLKAFQQRDASLGETLVDSSQPQGWGGIGSL